MRKEWGASIAYLRWRQAQHELAHVTSADMLYLPSMPAQSITFGAGSCHLRWRLAHVKGTGLCQVLARVRVCVVVIFECSIIRLSRYLKGYCCLPIYWRWWITKTEFQSISIRFGENIGWGVFCVEIESWESVRNYRYSERIFFFLLINILQTKNCYVNINSF